MADRQAEIEHEQAYVDRVYERLEAIAAEARSLAEEGRTRGLLDDQRGVKWDDYEALFQRDALVSHASRRLASINAEHSGLVFGRLDRRGGETDYVGRLGIWDEDYDRLVIDWRAPAAAVFYQATAVQPMGVIRRRVLRSFGARVTGLEDDLLDADAAPPGLAVVGDGALMGALTAARGSAMRDIVATIQREQDEVIRAAGTGATLIGGGPGTGKTVVALHRAAYLLYADRRRYEGGGVLVIGPTPGFMRYIEQVLPSLGERSVTLRATGEVLDGVDATRHDEPALAAVKGTTRMLPVLRAAVVRPPADGPSELRLFHGGKVLRLDARRLAGVRSAALRGGRAYNRSRGDAVRALLTALWRRADSGLTRPEFGDEVADRPDLQDFVDEWWPVLTPADVLRSLGDADRLAGCAPGSVPEEQIGPLAGSWAKGEDWSVEDVPLLDELRVLLGTPRPVPAESEPLESEGVWTFADRDDRAARRRDRPADYDEYAHVLVDEAQDLSPMQWRMLGRRARLASWTIVGDPAQSSWPAPEEAAAARDEAIGAQPRHRFVLSTNYRNPEEIFDHAAALIRRVVPDAELPRAVRSTGHPPQLRPGPADPERIEAAVRELLEQVDGTVGVIVPAHRIAAVTAAIADHDRASAVTALDCKGMEYDGVLVVEPDRIVAESPMGERILYVALTRATQRLITLA